MQQLTRNNLPGPPALHVTCAVLAPAGILQICQYRHSPHAHPSGLNLRNRLPCSLPFFRFTYMIATLAPRRASSRAMPRPIAEGAACYSSGAVEEGDAKEGG